VRFGLPEEYREPTLAALRDAAEKRIPTGSSEEAVPMLLDDLVADPGAFRRPVRPVDEVLAAAGFERRGFSFGRTGEQWKSLGEQVYEQRRRTLAQTWGISACCHEAFSLVTATITASGTAVADPVTARDAMADDPVIADFAGTPVEPSKPRPVRRGVVGLRSGVTRRERCGPGPSARGPLTTTSIGRSSRR